MPLPLLKVRLLLREQISNQSAPEDYGSGRMTKSVVTLARPTCRETKMNKFWIGLVCTALAACQNQGPLDVANVTEEEANEACARADIKDQVLDEVLRSRVASNIGKNGLLMLVDENGLITEAAVESLKQRSSVESAQGKKASNVQMDCTVNLVTTVSDDDDTPVEFRGVKFSIMDVDGEDNYRIVTDKASFFRNVFVDGMSKAQWDGQKQAEAEMAVQAETEAEQAAVEAQAEADDAAVYSEEQAQSEQAAEADREKAENADAQEYYANERK